MKIKTLISLLFLMGLFQPLLSQEDPLKEYAEDKRERKFCLYASTLRMVNISQNEDFNEMVNGIEKLLIYKLDSSARADKSYKEMLTTYQEMGYDEYIAMYGGKTQMFLYGKEQNKNGEFVGVFKDEDMAIAFYLRGQIGWAKIPELMNSFQAGDMLNVLDFKTENFENNPHNN
jgi:hypothetical protein